MTENDEPYVTRPWPGMTSERIEFFRARVAEDEATAKTAKDRAECQAKQLRFSLVIRLSLVDPAMAIELLNIELLPYAGHPDYQEAWRPI